MRVKQLLGVQRCLQPGKNKKRESSNGDMDELPMFKPHVKHECMYMLLDSHMYKRVPSLFGSNSLSTRTHTRAHSKSELVGSFSFVEYNLMGTTLQQLNQELIGSGYRALSTKCGILLRCSLSFKTDACVLKVGLCLHFPSGKADERFHLHHMTRKLGEKQMWILILYP